MRVKTRMVIVLAGLLILVGCAGEVERHDSGAESTVSVSVKVEKVRAEKVMSAHQAVGTVSAKVGATLSSKILGKVLAVHVTEGDRVRVGELLVEIDSREADAQVGLSLLVQELTPPRQTPSLPSPPMIVSRNS
jgi:multidrug efflux pump subunit AcrA (membrane-fusion protein)